MLCEYGCGKEATNILKNGKHICGKGPSSCEVNKQRNSNGLKNAYENGVRLSGEQKYKNLSSTTKDKMAWRRGKSIVSDTDVFAEYSVWSPAGVRHRILKNKLLDYKCESCNISEWQGHSLSLDLDHKNGNNRDNRLENLRFLCPNCHSLTNTFRGKNINSGVKKVSDEELWEAYVNEGNTRKALIKVGLSPKGGNYLRVQRLIDRNIKNT